MDGELYMKKRTEFSKKLAISIIACFFILIIFSTLTWFLDDRIPSEILDAVKVPFGFVVTSYFVKSGYENGKKIEKGSGDIDQS